MRNPSCLYQVFVHDTLSGRALISSFIDIIIIAIVQVKSLTIITLCDCFHTQVKDEEDFVSQSAFDELEEQLKDK